MSEGLGIWRDVVDRLRDVPPIFRQHYWDRPIPREVGDPDPGAICDAVGHALSQWGLADQALADLFVSLTDSRSLGNCLVVRRSYYSIQRHADRRRAIRTAAKAYFSQYRIRKVVGPLASTALDEGYAFHARAYKMAKQSIADTIDATERAAERHDDISHGVTWSNVKLYYCDRDFKSFLMPPEYNTGTRIAGRPDESNPWGFAQSRYRYTSADIASFAVKFMALRDSIVDCARKIDLVTERYYHYLGSLPGRFAR